MLRVNITKRLGGRKFSYGFESDKDRVVVFGPSGAGKSNLIKMIIGFYPPDDGIVCINGKVFFDSEKKINIPVNKRNIGYVPQEYTLFPHLSVKDNILYGVKVRKGELDTRLFEFLITSLNIRELLDRFPEDLSGGEKQRVAIARSFIVSPDLLIFDEPFSSLDKPIKEKLIDMIDVLLKNVKIPSIFITHDMDDAFLLGDDVVIVDGGSVLEYGEKDRIFSRPKYLETATLVNFKNIWRINSLENDKIVIGDETFEFIRDEVDDFEYMGIRPENVMIRRRGSDIEKENEVKVRVRLIKRFSGFFEIVASNESLGKVFIRLPEHAFNKLFLKENDEIKVSFKKEALIKLRRFQHV